MPRADWNLFLNKCRAVIGAESGTYYLNERGRLLERARAYNLHENRAASFTEVFNQFYNGQPREVSGKSVSSRHFEPIGAKTCQILLEGHYNGILKPDEHYIPVRRDLADVQEAIGKFRDEGFRQKIVENAYDYVMSGHTYDHRVRYLMSVVS
jgi:spore maturation protein CgeB